MPLTAAIGTNAATTVKVARMVGLPTSLTASIAVPMVILLSISQRLYIFSVTTMASSTKIPIEKISANKLTRSMVIPKIHAAKIVINNTTGITSVTTTAGRHPSANHTNKVTAPVAIKSFLSSAFTLSLADLP